MTAPEKPTPKRPALDDETAGMLEDFCEAHYGANLTAVANRAVQHFIRHDVSQNDGVRAAFDALQLKRGKKADPS
jgi:hypothetical protein